MVWFASHKTPVDQASQRISSLIGSEVSLSFVEEERWQECKENPNWSQILFGEYPLHFVEALAKLVSIPSVTETIREFVHHIVFQPLENAQSVHFHNFFLFLTKDGNVSQRRIEYFGDFNSRSTLS